MMKRSFCCRSQSSQTISAVVNITYCSQRISSKYTSKEEKAPEPSVGFQQAKGILMLVKSKPVKSESGMVYSTNPFANVFDGT